MSETTSDYRHEEIGLVIIDALESRGYAKAGHYKPLLSRIPSGLHRYENHQQNMVMDLVMRDTVDARLVPIISTTSLVAIEEYNKGGKLVAAAGDYIWLCAERFAKSFPPNVVLSPEEMYMPTGTALASMISRNGIYVRLVTVYDIRIDSLITRVDVLWQWPEFKK